MKPKKNIDNKFDSMDSNDTLTGEGKKQLSHLCTFLDKYWRSGSVIYTSPRKRSELTAKKIAEHLGLTYSVVESLPPINPGELAGLKEKTAWEKYPSLMETRVRFRDKQCNGYKICFPKGDSLYDYENDISNGFSFITV